MSAYSFDLGSKRKTQETTKNKVKICESSVKTATPKLPFNSSSIGANPARAEAQRTRHLPGTFPPEFSYCLSQLSDKNLRSRLGKGYKMDQNGTNAQLKF